MFKPQMKFQKIMYMVLLIISVFVFLYALGLCTDLYGLYRALAYGSVDGAEYYKTIQDYNEDLVTFSIVTILASVLPFIFSANKRRKYYLDNLISTIVQGVVYVACSIFLFINTTNYKNEFISTVDLEAYADFCERKGLFYSGTTIWFDLGYVCAVLLIVSTIVLALNYYWKYKLVENENKLINEGVK